ncbi:hypothetical protein [Consotaella aegiceratis]|uniref:hypothetical protein n=1 Tax=Consotaella aegiceratis TaxID=3097961 RepID=UPI002F412492
MIHYTAMGGHPFTSALSEEKRRQYRTLAETVEKLQAVVREAEQAAAQSLAKANAAPRPHTGSNPTFMALYDAHTQHREALFRAMRNLDDARQALDSMTADLSASNAETVRRALRDEIEAQERAQRRLDATG